MLPVHLLEFLRSRKIINRALVALLATLIPLQPLLPSISYVMAAQLTVEEGAREGQALWGDLKSGLAFPDTQGGTVFRMGDGEQVPIHELFHAGSRDDSLKGMYGIDNEEFEQQGVDARFKLQTAKTPEGEAYRTLRESAYLSKPDLNKDPIWGSTDAVFDFIAGKPVDCTPPDRHTPDYRQCTRLNIDTNGCEIVHDIKIKPRPTDIVFLVDNSGSMDSVIASLRNSVSNLVSILSQEDERDLRLGGAVTRESDYTFNNVNLTEPYQFQQWINSVRTKGAQTYNVHAADWVLSNFSWRTDPAVERLIVIIGNEDNPNGDGGALKARAAAMDVQIYVFHDNAGQKALGIDLGNGFSVVGMLNMLKNLVDVEDKWGPAKCITAANVGLGNSCSRSVRVTGGASTNTECLMIGGLNVCPGDIIWKQISESPVAGIPRLAKTVAVSPVVCNYSGNTGSCQQLEASPTCGFITSTCIDGTPEELVRNLYTFGLGREPSAGEIAYWAGRLRNGEEYDAVRAEFFRVANVNNEKLINEFSCKTFQETYDCGYTETSNAGACAVQDLFKNDFADCVEDLVPTETTQIVKIEKTETCEEALELTQCTVERQLTPVARSSETTYARGCFITDEVSYRVPWWEAAISASSLITVSGSNTSAQIIQQPAASNGWTTRVKMSGPGQMVTKTRQVERTCKAGETAPCYADEQYQALECPSGTSLSVTLKTQGYAMDVKQTERPAEAGNAPCLRDTDDWTTTTWVCEQHTPLTVAGVPFTAEALASALKPIYPGAPATCIRGKANYQTKAYGEGEFCWSDLQGRQQCTTVGSSGSVKPGTNTCSSLQQRAAKGECRYDGRFPIQDGTGSTGFHYVWEHRYTCVQSSKEVTTTELVPQYTCEGIVRCMGTECMTPSREASADFGKAAAMLQAVQQIGQDVTCDVTVHGDMSNCRVFSGEASTCKMALGGYVDCCESPGGVSIGDYITMLKATARMDNYLTSESVMQPIRGSYSALRDPVVDSVQYAKQAFTEQLDNLSGAIFGEGGGGAAGGALDAAKVAMEGFQQAIMSGANDFLAETFGQEVASMFFDVAADGVVSLAGPFAAALSVIGLIYTIYSIAKILVNIVWKCSQDELALGVDIELHKSHYVGSYCAKKTIVGCVEKRKSYCVFSSPLARIINEQARPQLGRGWGTPKSPDCSGITLAELERLDWNQIDLTEWMDLLKITDNMPGMQDLDIESLTGSGSWLGQSQAASGETRLNTADRNRERLEGTDLQKLNQEAAAELWRGQ